MPRASRIMPAMSPAAKLRAARIAAELSQAEVAERAGVTRSWVSQLEQGWRDISLNNAERMARAIGCDPHAIDPRLASTRQADA